MKVQRQVITADEKVLYTEYSLVLKYANQPMHVRVYADGDVAVSGRATRHQIGALIEAILKDKVNV